jgi:serine protease Do
MKLKESTIRLFVSALCLLVSVAPAVAQRGGRSLASNLRDGREVKSAFHEIVAAADQSTVRVKGAGKDVALGAVVGADGWILTKYSELREPLTCRLSSGRELPAKVVGQDSKYDLAMLKIEATGLKPVVWADATDGPEVGQFLATASPGDMPQAIGVVSVPRRAIPVHFTARAQLGVALDDGSDAVKIAEVTPGSAAARAGLQAGDIVLRIDDKAVSSREKMVETIHQHDPGDKVTLAIHRGGEDLNITASLASPRFTRSDRMNAMGSELSKFASGFPSVIQHDTVLQASDCGGPVVDLSGKVVGINIARAGRTESYAAPADQVCLELDDLERGKLAPKEPLPGAKPTIDAKETKTVDKKADSTKAGS